MTNRHLARQRLVTQEVRTAIIPTPARSVLQMDEVREDVLREAHQGDRWRAPEGFKPRKTDDEGRVTLALAAHVYGRFKVPHHLERVWFTKERAARTPLHGRHGLGLYERPDRSTEVLPRLERSRRIAWYVCAASGGSLHKQFCKDFFTKKETHAFMTAPGRLTFVEALWYAVASSLTDDHGVRLRIMRSKIARPHVTAFWKDVARFAIVHDVAINEINDCVDFFVARLDRDPTYSLSGRTLSSVRRARADWHRTLSRIKHYGGGSWEGVALPDYALTTASGDSVAIRQLLMGNALAEEGSSMHHCAYSYKLACEKGTASIWSMTRNNKRALTIEVNNAGEIVQIRGFGNRLATDEEMRVIAQWARKDGLIVTNRGW